MRPLLLVYAKAPVAGRVKTRLCPPLSPEQAARAHAAFVADTIETLLGFTSSADVELATDEETQEWDWLGVKRCLQAAGDLGTRLFSSLADALAAGREKAIVFGSDSPSLPRAHVAVLLESRAEVTCGPCDDGGFYAIACRRVHPGMFAGVRWSTPHALEDVLNAARQCGLSVALAPRWFDVDTAEDLNRLVAPLPPRRTREVLEELSMFPRRRSSNP